jgi:hypothetical protein
VTIKLFLCYTGEDEDLARQLKQHLVPLEHLGLLTLWDRGRIQPGAEWAEEARVQLAEAQIILLLLSASFLASHYHYTVEMRQAIARHERREARVIPVILRDVFWKIPPLDKLQPLPDPPSKPIARWRSRDEGFLNVATGIRRVLDQFAMHGLPGPLAERRAFTEGMERLFAAVEGNMQPPGRANAMVHTLQQLSNITPTDVTLADLVVGWRLLARPAQETEAIAIERRRATCGELAMFAQPLLDDQQGTLAGALKAWQSWLEVFTNSNDPRRDAMAETFARELSELQHYR